MNKENITPKVAKTVRNNHSISHETTQTVKNSCNIERGSLRNDSYQKYMKYLIATNVDYFQNKLKGPSKDRPKDIKFKIPCRTGVTIYRKDYDEKKIKSNNQSRLKHYISADCIKTNNFLKEDNIDATMTDKTTYQKEYRYHPIKADPKKKLKRHVEKSVNDQDVPRFFDTQNKTDFLNWAGKNYVPSMKPEHKSAVTNCPFEGTSMYKSDFEGKSSAPTPMFIRQPSFPKFGNFSMVMRTNYSNDYSQKKSNNIEIDCKPKYYQANLCKQFKGTTQYKRQFIKNRKEQTEQSEYVNTIQDLQTLIIDL